MIEKFYSLEKLAKLYVEAVEEKSYFIKRIREIGFEERLVDGYYHWADRVMILRKEFLKKLEDRPISLDTEVTNWFD